MAAADAGVYTSHIRDEADYNVGVVAAVDEVIQIAAQAGLPSVVTHIKALGPRVWGASSQLIQRIEQARRRGIQIFADQYPYQASATGLSAALVPRWAEAGGRQALLQRLENPGHKLVEEMARNLERRGGADRIGIRAYPADPSLEGLLLSEIASRWKVGPLEAARQMIMKSPTGIVSYNMIAEDVERLMARPWVMTSSDGGLVPLGQGVPHPRNYGSFARKVHHYALQQKTLDLSDAIRSMTSLPASVFGLNDRGRLIPGQVADLVVFDRDAIRDLATYNHPHRLAEGVVHLLIAGHFVIRDGNFTGQRPGAVLRKDSGNRD